MENNENNSNFTSFDEMTFSNRLQMLKMLFPYMPPASRKLVSSYIKASELSNAFKMCDSPSSEASLFACDAQSRKSPLELLNEIKCFCTKKERENVDMALNIYNAMNLYKTFSDFEGNNTNGEKPTFFDTLKNMLTPEQQAIFNNYQETLNNE